MNKNEIVIWLGLTAITCCICIAVAILCYNYDIICPNCMTEFPNGIGMKSATQFRDCPYCGIKYDKAIKPMYRHNIDE